MAHFDYWRIEEFCLNQAPVLSCFYCGIGPLDRRIKRKSPMRATIDHYKPKSKGGSSSIKKNGVVACSPCNRDKGVLSPEEFQAVLSYRKLKAIGGGE